jgi:tetratricopeptide (TPR) repeat protein
MTETKTTYRLWEAFAVAVATLFGFALGGAALMAINYKNLGQKANAWKCFAIGFVLSIGQVWLEAASPKNCPGILANLLVVVAAYFIAERLQGEAINAALTAELSERKATRGSAWQGFGLGLLAKAVLVVLCLVWIIIFPTPEMLAERDAKSYADQGDYQDAINEWSKAIAVKPDRIEYYLERASAYEGLAQHRKAIDDCSKVLALAPTETRAYELRAKAYERLGEDKNSLADCREASKGFADAGLLLTCAVLNSKMGEFESALADCEKSTLVARQYYLKGDIYCVRANIFEKHKEHEKAISEYKKALESYSSSMKVETEKIVKAPSLAAKIYLKRACVYIDLGEYQSAVDDCAQAIGAAPQLAEAYYVRSRAYRSLGNADLANNDAEAASKLGYKIDSN